MPRHSSPALCRFTALGWNVFAFYERVSGVSILSFFRVPPVLSQKPLDRWSILEFDFVIVDLKAYLPDNILAVAEKSEP